jgi:hypothetical protein
MPVRNRNEAGSCAITVYGFRQNGDAGDAPLLPTVERRPKLAVA